jgi:hypothetical protein
MHFPGSQNPVHYFYNVHSGRLMKSSHILITFAAVAVFGCTNSPPKKSEHLIRTITPTTTSAQLVKLPKIGEVYSIEIGDSLIYEYHKIEIPTLEVLDTYVVETSNKGVKFSVTIKPGIFIAKGKDETGVFYQIAKGRTYIDGKFNGEQDPNDGIYVDNNDPVKTEFYTLVKDGRPLNFFAPNIKIRKFVDEKIDPSLFKRELVYTGVSKNIITILYREYSEGIARPAFSQELKYDLSEGRIVGFKGARFEVIKATNTGLTYKAISHLY